MKDITHTVATSPTLRRLLVDHQTWCKVDCCKERAFQISEETISRWLGFERVNRAREIAEEIGRVRADLHSATGRVFLAARDLESDWDADCFRAFWGRFEEAFALAVEARERADA